MNTTTKAPFAIEAEIAAIQKDAEFISVAYQYMMKSQTTAMTTATDTKEYAEAINGRDAQRKDLIEAIDEMIAELRETKASVKNLWS